MRVVLLFHILKLGGPYTIHPPPQPPHARVHMGKSYFESLGQDTPENF